MILLQW